MKQLYIFDLDGTITPSKSPVEETTAALLCKLLHSTKVAIVTGSGFGTIESRLLRGLSCGKNVYENLVLVPTNGAAFYVWQDGAFVPLYEEMLSAEEKQKIFDAFKESMEETGFVMPEKMYGMQIEDRASQITFSALGQDAPLSEKMTWDPDQKKRQTLRDALLPKLPEFEIRIGGTTSIDITRKGIDKAYAIGKILSYLSIPIEEAQFIGDALFEGGNDATAKETGIETVAVRGPQDTRLFMEGILTETVTV